MPLSVSNPIVFTDIASITMFKALKVWLLKGHNDDKVVIKIDAIHAPQIKGAKTFIKVVDPRAKVKILTPAERTGLSAYVTATEDFNRDYKAMTGTDFDADEVEAVKDLK